MGRSGAAFSLDRCTVRVGGIAVLERGQPVGADLDAVRAAFGAPPIRIDVDLGAGEAAAHAWGCDLTTEYVHINADYTT